MRLKNFVRYSVFLIPAVMLSACSSKIPPDIRQSLEGAPGVAEVHEQPNLYRSQKIRWGGVILQTENKAKVSSITIVAFPLGRRGNPQLSDQSEGRFIAVINEFVEPLVYGRDREITVTGTLVGTQTAKVGEFSYQYPVVDVENYYLWPPKAEIEEKNCPSYWRYDPWLYPYYPYYPRYLIPNSTRPKKEGNKPGL